MLHRHQHKHTHHRHRRIRRRRKQKKNSYNLFGRQMFYTSNDDRIKTAGIPNKVSPI